jgi:DNA replication and repair protein RecF
LLIGRNGRGKTNLVEAIGYLSTLGSHRVAGDAPLVRHGATQALIHAGVEEAGRTTAVDVAIIPGKVNKARINAAPVPKVRDILGVVRTVLFAPEDLAIVKGDPSERRRFIDDFLIQRRPRIAAVRSDYDRVLKQRNALLKSARTVRGAAREAMVETLLVWDEQLAKAGATLTVERIEAIAALRPYLLQHYGYIADDNTISMTYRNAMEAEIPEASQADAWEAALLAAMTTRREDEIDRGITLVGPHRDDLVLGLGDFPAKGYASHGESWSIALALRLATLSAFQAEMIEPILLLDDVFAELDAKRRLHLAELVGAGQQVFITASVEADIPQEVSGQRFSVTEGVVQAA